MKIVIRNIVKELFPGIYLKFHLYNRLISQENSFLHQSGWVKSFKRGEPVDFSGGIIPWMNYAITSFLEKTLNKRLSVFEYGSGFSTKFFSERVNKVVSIEYDIEWYEKTKGLLVEPNVQLIFEEIGPKYVNSISRSGDEFDIIIIDGRERIKCLEFSLSVIKSDGVVIFDDSNVAKYLEAFAFMKDKGFKEISFVGFKPHSFKIAKTTIFYRDMNCLGI